MAWKQYSKVAVLLLEIVFLVVSIDSYCPNNQECDCTSDYINCTCSQREGIVFKVENSDVFSGKEVIIKGCGKVKLVKLSLQQLNVQLVYISDLLELQIEPHVFEEATIINFHIFNIKNFILESHGFANIKNITRLMISNVTLEKLEHAVFTDIVVPHLHIKNSYVGTIETKSLHLENVENIIIENNTINAIGINAIKIANINKFNFIRNSVNTTAITSISLSSAKEVHFGYCSFLQISTDMILTKEVDLFEFHNNYIKVCEQKAFWGIKLTKQVRFFDNQILVAKTDSLIPNLGPNELNSSVIVNTNNQIGCDCNLEWLLTKNNPKYDIIKESNVCHHPRHLKGLNLSLLIMSVDEDNNCNFLYALTSTGAPVITSPTTSEAEEKPITHHSTMIPKVEETTQIADLFTEQQVNDKLASHQVKQRSKENSADICLCNVILLFAMLSFSIF